MGMTSAIFSIGSPWEKAKRGINPFFVQRSTPPSQYTKSTIRIIPQPRFNLILSFECLDEHREDRSLEGIITGYERFA